MCFAVFMFDCLQCHYAGATKTYPGTIKSVNSEGRYTIRYEDGDFETNVDRSLIILNSNKTPLHVDVRACKTGVVSKKQKKTVILPGEPASMVVVAKLLAFATKAKKSTRISFATPHNEPAPTPEEAVTNVLARWNKGMSTS